jgi:hypothetical protein
MVKPFLLPLLLKPLSILTITAIAIMMLQAVTLKIDFFI